MIKMKNKKAQKVMIKIIDGFENMCLIVIIVLVLIVASIFSSIYLIPKSINNWIYGNNGFLQTLKINYVKFYHDLTGII